MKVAISSRNMNAAKEAAALLSKDDAKILAVESDVTSLSAETDAIKAVTDHFGQLDVLIANAGVGHFAPIDTLSTEQWNETIDTNLTGVFNSVKASIDSLKLSQGYIITIASLAGANFLKLPQPTMPANSDWLVLHKPSCST